MKPSTYYPSIQINFNGWTVEVVRLSFGEISSPISFHKHGKNCFEFHFIKNGRGTLLLEDAQHPISIDCFFVTGPEIMHAQLPDLKDPFVEYCLNLAITAKGDTKDSLLTSLLNMTTFLSENNTDLMLKIELLFSEFKHKKIGSEHYQQLLIQEILIDCIRLNNTQKPVNSQATISDTKALLTDHQRSLAIDQYFLHQYHNLSLEDLAQTLSLSSRQTQRLIKNYYQQSFTQKALETKMNVAKFFLLKTAISISELSEKTGYSSTEHFSYTFRKYWGTTPTKFRAKNKTKQD